MKKHVWKALSLVTIFLLIVCMVGTNTATAYGSILNQALDIETSRVEGGSGQSAYYVSDYANLEEMYQAKVQLLREIADEGVVLLKNDGALPLRTGKIAILGEDDFIFSTNSGGGSFTAEMKARSTTLTGALSQDGLTVADDPAGCDMALVVIGRMAGEGKDMALGGLTLTDDELACINTAKASGAKVVVLLSGDHPVEIAELEHDDGVSAILHLGNAGYRGAYGVADVITGVVSPSGKLVETYAVDTMSTPAMMNFGNYAYTNGSKIKASQAKNYVAYAEGIYTDYRYYETRYEDCVLGQGSASSNAGVYAGNGGWAYTDEVIYPFAYGLSYTSFSKELVGDPVFDDSTHTATITVKVTNTGSVAGKEVVTVFAQSPYTDYDVQNKVEKASVQLMGFEKTGELGPGESETLEIIVHLQWLASYDYVNAKTYIMDAGDYYFSIGGNAHEAVNNILAAKGKTTADGMTADGDPALTYKWTLSNLDTTTYATSVYTGSDITNAFADADINYWIPGRMTYLTRSDWAGTYPESLSLEASANMIASLNDTKKYENGQWNDSASRVQPQNVTYQDFTTLDAVNAGMTPLNAVSMWGKDYFDEGWDEILDNLSIYEMSRIVAQGRYHVETAPSVTFPGSDGSDSPIGLNIPYLNLSIDPTSGEKIVLPSDYTMTDGITDDVVAVDGTLDANMFSSESTLGATFNKSLACRQGDFWGEDGLYCSAGFTYAPGANMHRTPYGGRHSEYVSADPVHTSLMLAEVTKAANAKGQVITVKHFVINDQEQNRIGVATFTNEQALREVYMRAFEGVMTYGEARGMMSSYNRIGLISTSAEYDLLTVALRQEWGSQAYVITDLGSPTAGLYDGNAAIVAGVSTMMNNGVYDDTSKAHVNQTLAVESIKADPVLLSAVRDACHRILYNFIHSSTVNGIDAESRVVLITPWWKPLLNTLDIVFAAAAVATTALYLFNANKKVKGGSEK